MMKSPIGFYIGLTWFALQKLPEGDCPILGTALSVPVAAALEIDFVSSRMPVPAAWHHVQSA
jgi:hypothetical protein